MKGIEREVNKLRLTSLQAEIYLIRLRQAIDTYENASQEERDRVLESWGRIHGSSQTT